PENCNTKPHEEKNKKEPVFTKKENATLRQRVKILDWHHANRSNWLKNKEKYWAQYAEALARGQTGNAKREKLTEHPEVNEMLELWVHKAMSDGIELQSEILRKKWEHFADLVGVPTDERITCSKGWLDCFKKQYGLRSFKYHGEAGSADPQDVDREYAEVERALSHLENLGVLQHSNRMAINELLNPVTEDKMCNNETEKEIKRDIYAAVVERREAEQNREKNGGDVLDDDDEAISEKPSPYARKLEGILANFGHQTRLEEFQSLRPTTLAEFFTPKDV
ncbi:hypothetical protein C0989_010403, partial [Termitomyces sp. Mn162]